MGTTLSYMNYIGDIAFAAGGILMAQRVTGKSLIGIFAALLTAFGGGAIIRDSFLLITTPSILSCPIEIIAILALAFLMSAVNVTLKSAASRLILNIMDSIGILAFAIIGFERGLQLSSSLLIAILCGWATAVGGGVLARAMTSGVKGKRWLKQELYNNIPYYIFGLATTLVYLITRMSYSSDIYLVVIIIPIAVLGIIADRLIAAGWKNKALLIIKKGVLVWKTVTKLW
jgi:uncharacterized membrane protein YeiH